MDGGAVAIVAPDLQRIGEIDDDRSLGRGYVDPPLGSGVSLQSSRSVLQQQRQNARVGVVAERVVAQFSQPLALFFRNRINCRVPVQANRACGCAADNPSGGRSERALDEVLDEVLDGNV